MLFFVAATVAVFCASISPAQAIGSATTISKCPYPVYFSSVSGWTTPPMQRLVGSYTERYSQSGVGISIKLSLDETGAGPVTQFEFTWDANKIHYDLSNIDGYPFAVDGIHLQPSVDADPRHPTCLAVDCPPGEFSCSDAYNLPNDTRTLVLYDPYPRGGVESNPEKLLGEATRRNNSEKQLGEATRRSNSEKLTDRVVLASHLFIQ